MLQHAGPKNFDYATMIDYEMSGSPTLARGYRLSQRKRPCIERATDDDSFNTFQISRSQPP